jgi:hypothetical protein
MCSKPDNNACKGTSLQINGDITISKSRWLNPTSQA